MNASLKALLNEQYKLVAELREENKKLKEEIRMLKKGATLYREDNKKLKSDVDVYKSQRYAYKKKYLALLRANTELDEENRKLREESEKANEVSAIDFERVNEILQLRDKIERLEFDVDAWRQLKLLLEGEIEKLKETIKDHQLYEEKLEHRIIEFEELLHGE